MFLSDVEYRSRKNLFTFTPGIIYVNIDTF